MAPPRFDSFRAFRKCPFFRVAALGLVALATGCMTRGEYLVYSDSLRVARATVTESSESTATVPVSRVSDGKRVLLRTSAIVEEVVEDERVTRVHAEAPAPRITAGSILTWIGTALSLAGSGWFFFGPQIDHGTDTLHVASGILAAAAEPIMITGTALWIVGTMRPGQEARGNGVALTGVGLGTATDGARVASLRFRF